MTEHQWSEWFEHTPGPCPVPLGTLVDSFSLCVNGLIHRRQWRVKGGNSFRVKSPTEMVINGRYVRQVILYRYRISAHLIEMRQKAADLTPIKTVEVA